MVQGQKLFCDESRTEREDLCLSSGEAVELFIYTEMQIERGAFLAGIAQIGSHCVTIQNGSDVSLPGQP